MALRSVAGHSFRDPQTPLLPGDERHDAVLACGIEKLLLRGRPRERPLGLLASDERGQHGFHRGFCTRRRTAISGVHE